MSPRRRVKQPTRRAPSPKIPDPLDDGACFHEEMSTDSEHEVDDPMSTESVHEETGAGNPGALDNESILQRPRRREKPCLSNMPLEIRLAIYKYLLVTNSPIRVHSGWRFVFKRQSLGIPTGILRTCWRVYKEAIGVLYGSNTFLYVLRDHVARVTDVDRLAEIDDPDAPFPINGDIDEDYDVEDENDPDWREETSGQNGLPRRSSRRRGARTVQGDINIDKYSCLFQNIIVEAEQNRSFERSKKLMANALNLFKYDDRANRHRVFNIHTLTVRVTPKWEPPKEENGSGHYTFVDFFNRESPVMEAVWRIHCQFLLVDVMGCSEDGAIYLGRQFKIDMRHLRLNSEAKRTNIDAWRNDKVIQRQRMAFARRTVMALATLDRHVAATCEEHLEQTLPGDDWDEWVGAI
ncbi:hypothetical protein X797_010226 [Metarhizium robertsii]|uniref:Uncharacterized protein n=2 Tax=Metarhizium robertsii TaxID=568076 RepID=E9EKI3_METRA|nr:uncharacterized protein MAA_00131 [Metarhizium robertsii ARSEF 23]EFZ03057.1 hypothetical protein MAA_00131 [Metarhizium robertsii ARSEF 23]EXU96682.1 hypothetical protein X797_010226 [Metarhizium robertsii]